MHLVHDDKEPGTVRSDLFGQQHLESQTTERLALQNPRLLRVALNGDVMA